MDIIGDYTFFLTLTRFWTRGSANLLPGLEPDPVWTRDPLVLEFGQSEIL